MVTVTVRLFNVLVSVAAAKACAVVLPGSVSEDAYYVATDLAMDVGLAGPAWWSPP